MTTGLAPDSVNQPSGSTDSSTQPAESDLPVRPSTSLVSSPTPDAAQPSFLVRGWRGNQRDALWVRPALLGLLAATAVLYLGGLGASDWANSFYSAAAQAGSDSWKAFFFGSSDAANAITVDKPPMSLWAMALSVRLFGLSSWSILVPQALMGVASVGLLYATVRRTANSPVAGLLAGTVLATTPVATLMFRFNNPDALLLLLLIGSVAATLRAIAATTASERTPKGRARVAVRWLALAGALVGFAFLTKMMQAFLVLPGLALAYLWAANLPVVQRIKHVLVAFAAMVLAAGWWIAIVELWPASSRPYIGGSQHDSILELTLGYNGFGRLTGDEAGSVGGGGGWGSTGWLRMLNSEIGGQISWLLPLALLLLVAGLWISRHSPRTDLMRAGLIAWGGWLVVTTLTFSFMAGIFHAYYTVALAPAIAAVVAIVSVGLWRHRDHYAAALCLAVGVALTSSLAFFLLDRTPDFLPWLKWVVVSAGLASALMLGAVRHLTRPVALSVAAVAVASVLAGPTAYSLETASTPHTGSIPSAGPNGSGMGGPGGAPGGMAGGPGGTGSSTGGLLQGSTSSAGLTALLQENADAYTWAAAAIGSNTASGYQLASEEPVMAIGGFNGSDPSPTLAEFEALVQQGEVHYFIASGAMAGGGGMAPGGGTTSEISTWVSENFPAQTVDGVTLYDLTAGVE